MGDWERAIRHAVAGKSADVAADLILELTPTCMAHGRSETLKRWYSWLSEEEVVAHPHAALGPGWAAINEGDLRGRAATPQRACSGATVSGSSATAPRSAGSG